MMTTLRPCSRWCTPLIVLAIAAGMFIRPADIAAETPLASATNLPFTTVIAIQTRLDRMNLSCGCIDGKFGEKTRNAIEVWMNNPRLSRTNATIQTAVTMLGSEEGAFAEHIVTEEAITNLTPIPPKWADKATMPTMGYETILEAVAEHYHASQAAIRDLNPDMSWPNPPAGSRLRVPNPFPAARVRAARLQISLTRKTICVLDADGAIAAYFPCTIAAKAENRPVGELKITTLVEHPNYTFDPALFAEDADARSMTTKAILSPGPNNPVGTVWIGLDKAGYGIHGTPNPEDIGKAASHGCFRLANWNAEKLVAMIKIGMPVVITQD
ncbi:MAG: L,D-transpeptidase [Kiritimatiellaeota bacterium]|nr:L,D-transpeptidase [Kiritimatiellota bacterium]